MPVTLDDLRRFAIHQTLFTPTTLKQALQKFGFVQADPIRAPARAQDLILRHRARNYRAGDLERHYAALDIAEDFFINYGFVTKSIQALMHPRSDTRVLVQSGVPWTAARRKRAQLLLDFIRDRGEVHPRDVTARFSHGKVKNYWGGSSNTTTHLMDAMHYQGILRVVRRESGIRIYAAHEHGAAPLDESERHARIDQLVDVAVRIYAPLPGKSLVSLIRALRFAIPQWQNELTGALQRAKQRLMHTRIDGLEWHWPAESDPASSPIQDRVRLLAPFDPVVWDRTRFELLWGWVYRFEAYTPVHKRIRGYYALPLLWQDRVIGWANLSVDHGRLKSEFGYIKSEPRDRGFKRELADEMDRMRAFLSL